MNPIRLSSIAALFAALLGGCPLAAFAQAPSAVEAMKPQTFLAKKDDVSVRADAGFVYREVRRLAKDEAVEVNARQGDWLRLSDGGWVNSEEVWTREEAAAASPPVTHLVVIKEGARVRESPRTDAAIVATLAADAVVDATGQQDGWWSLASGGFISAQLVREQQASASPAASASTPERPLPWVVSADSANVRSDRNTTAPVVRRLARGDVVAVSSVVSGWAQVDGGWVRQDLLQPPAPRSAGQPRADAGAPPPRRPPSEVAPQRWSVMDLHGTLIEVYELADPGLIQAIRDEMRATKVLEADWTFLGLSISVAKDSPMEFRYSPDGNATAVVDAQGQKYGNVYARGPIDRLPAHVRGLLAAHEVQPGARFDGVLLFRPTLHARDIAKVTFMLEGRPQTLTQAK